MYAVYECEHRYCGDGVSASFPYNTLFKGTMEECHNFVVKNNITAEAPPEEWYGEDFDLVLVGWDGEGEYGGKYEDYYPAHTKHMNVFEGL